MDGREEAVDRPSAWHGATRQRERGVRGGTDLGEGTLGEDTGGRIVRC